MTMLTNPANHLFALARLGKRLPHVILAVGLTFVFVLVAQIGGGIPAALIVLALSLLNGGAFSADNPDALTRLILPDTALEQTIFLTLAFGPVFLLLWGWLALFEKRPFWTLGMERPGALFKYGRGLLVGLLMFAGAVGMSAILGFMAFEPKTPAQPQGLAAMGGILLVLVGWMVQGAAEEVLARGWLLPVVGARYRPWLGIILSALVFAALHSLNPNLNPIAMTNLFLFGLFTAFYALREGGLWGVFGIHTAWNWAQGNLFGLEVSGLPPAGGTLFNLVETGPDAVTGGPFGPEGGLAVTLVLLVSCALVWWRSQSQAAQ